jgi:hypothetical protein
MLECLGNIVDPFTPWDETLYYENAWRDKRTGQWIDASFHFLEQVEFYKPGQESALALRVTRSSSGTISCSETSGKGTLKFSISIVTVRSKAESANDCFGSVVLQLCSRVEGRLDNPRSREKLRQIDSDIGPCHRANAIA